MAGLGRRTEFRRPRDASGARNLSPERFATFLQPPTTHHVLGRSGDPDEEDGMTQPPALQGSGAAR